MREVVRDVRRWRAGGRPVAIATVARVHGSGLQPLGAVMACTDDAEIAGSVSGGCIESAVYEEAQEVLAGGPPRLLHFGVSHELAWSVGLACGGEVEVWVEALDDAVFEAIAGEVEAGERVARVSVVAGEIGFGRSLLVRPEGSPDGGLGSPALDEAAVRLARERLAGGGPLRAAVEVDGRPAELLVEVHAPVDRLVVVGAVHIAIPLVAMAEVVGYRTVVVDPRAAFATRRRFPHADELIQAWPATVLAGLAPDRSTDVVVLTHDDKIDVPVLREAVRSRARYVGILGSRGHQAQRVAALRELGVPDEELARVHAPIGLPLGAVGPQEIAVAILAELVAVRHPAAPTPPRGL
jgi:xanthine dehydrogenase accessory factor